MLLENRNNKVDEIDLQQSLFQKLRYPICYHLYLMLSTSKQLTESITKDIGKSAQPFANQHAEHVL